MHFVNRVRKITMPDSDHAGDDRMSENAICLDVARARVQELPTGHDARRDAEHAADARRGGSIVRILYFLAPVRRSFAIGGCCGIVILLTRSARICNR